MKRIRPILIGAIVIVSASATLRAQSYNAMSGGYNTGYGTVYGSFGMAAASQNMFNQLQMQMNQNILRATLVRKHGAAAIEKAEAQARSGVKTSIPVTPRPIPNNYGRFRPDPTVDTARTIADVLAETPEEKALMKQIVDGTKAAFEKDPEAATLKNNLAGAFTFFIVATGTIYHDSPDPSDDTVKALFEAINQTIDEIPEFGKMTNRDKQSLYNTLIGFAGIPLATYSEGKEMKHEPTIQVSRQLAGQLIEIVLKCSPDRFKFVKGEMKFS